MRYQNPVISGFYPDPSVCDAELVIRADSLNYSFFVRQGEAETCMGTAQSKFLANEVSTCFTSTMLGLFAQKQGQTLFENLHIRYEY